jgi:hypothetical protein
MTQPESMRTRIARFAKNYVDSGRGTYQEASDKLGISNRTLLRYRNGYAGKRGENAPVDEKFPDVSPQIRNRMKRGGKLTQLRQAQKEYEREQQEPPEEPDEPEPGEPFRLSDSSIRTPTLAPDAVRKVGRTDTPRLDEAITEGREIEVRLNRVAPGGSMRRRRWEIGEPPSEEDPDELLDQETVRIDTGRVLDSVELESILWNEVIMPIVYGQSDE